MIISPLISLVTLSSWAIVSTHMYFRCMQNLKHSVPAVLLQQANLSPSLDVHFRVSPALLTWHTSLGYWFITWKISYIYKQPGTSTWETCLLYIICSLANTSVRSCTVRADGQFHECRTDPEADVALLVENPLSPKDENKAAKLRSFVMELSLIRLHFTTGPQASRYCSRPPT